MPGPDEVTRPYWQAEPAPTRPIGVASRPLELLVQAVVMVADNVFEGLRHGFGALVILVRPFGWRTGFNWGRGFPVMEQFSGECHRRRQSQQG